MLQDFDISTFQHPPSKYRPFPFWFLNDDLKMDHIEWMLHEFAKDGRYGGVVLHPRTGMEVPYLSDEFFEKWKRIVEKCKELGLFVILYDEYNWPSGAIGGKLLREHPEFRQKYLAFESFHETKAIHKKMPRPGDIIIKAFGIAPDHVDDLTRHITGSVEFKYTEPNAYEHVLLFYVKMYQGQLFNTTCAPHMNGELGYIDLLNPAAIGYFIQETHERYKRYLGVEFGKTIIGMFIDEPSNYEAWQYTDALFGQFKARYNYDLRDRLYQLVIQRGEWRQTRYDYHAIATDLYTASFRRIGAWCADNHLAFTGHLNQEDVLHEIPSNHGDVWEPYSQMHVPGLDYLADQNGMERPNYISEAPNFAAKMVASITHAQQREWNLVEVFGGCGWQTTPTQMKNTVLWLEASGISGINVHAVFSSIKGLRKRDFPASHFTQEPWWACYGQFSDLCARLSYFNRSGVHRCKVLYLFPKTEFWMLQVPTNISEEFDNFKHIFLNLGDALLRNHVDYDYLFEDQVLSRQVQLNDSGCTLGEESYNLVVLPPVSTLPTEVLEFLARFLLNGGHILFSGILPVNSPARAKDPKHQELLHQMLTPDGFQTCMSIINGKDGETIPQILKHPHNLPGNDALVIFLPLRAKENEDELRTHLRDLLAPIPSIQDIIIEGPGTDWLLNNHRSSGESENYLVVNLSSSPVHATITFPSTGMVTALDPETGSPIENPPFRILEANLRLQIAQEFPPNVGIIYHVRSQSPIPQPQDALGTPRVIKQIALLPWNLQFPPKGNLFLLDGPWTIEKIQPGPQCYQSPGTSLSPEIDLSKFPFRARFLINLVRFFVKITKLFIRKAKTIKMTRYQSLVSLMKLAKLQETIFGIKIENFGLYSKIELGKAIQDKLGIDLISTALQPGWEYELRYTLRLESVPFDLELIYEDLDMPLAIWINDHQLTLPGQIETVWDRANRVVSGISPLFRPGKNVIQIHSQVPNFPDLMPSIHGLEPMALRGSFLVLKNKMVPVAKDPVQSTGEWTKAGFPFLSQAMTYETTIELGPDSISAYARLRIDDARACASVKVNDVDCGKRAWAPFVFEVGHALLPGKNQFQVTIYNTAQNFFSNPIPSGLLSVPMLELLERK